MSKLSVIAENEVDAPERPQTPSESVQVFSRTAQSGTATSSATSSSEDSQKSVLVMMEIRKILNARASAVMAMAGAFALTATALVQGTTMALIASVSFDVLVFLPLAWIAYTRK